MASPGFVQAVQGVVVNSGTEPVVHLQLTLEGAKETINVSGAPVIAPTDSATPITLVDRLDIARTPGASLSNSFAKDFGERFSASLNALNVANRRVELDNSQTLGGFDWNYPREIYAEVRYRFHY